MNETEIAAIKLVASLTKPSSILDYIKARKTTELGLATFLDFRMQGGSFWCIFDIISAAGERSAMPHATPCDRVISAGSTLTMVQLLV